MDELNHKSLKDITYKETFYRSSEDNIPQIFYIPVLKVAKLYQRAVGYFCVSSLSCILEGVEGLLKNQGKIQLITSPQLTEEDVKEIEQGYSERAKIESVENILLRSFEDLNDQEKKQLSYVSILIKYGVLDIKIAVQEHGIYHDKIGIIHDNCGNTILFSGSMNETRNGMINNSEHFDVLKSWDEHDSVKINEEIKFFEETWNNTRDKVLSVDFPYAVKEKCLEYLPTTQEVNENPNYQKFVNLVKKTKEQNNSVFFLPDYFEIRDYQNNAIKKWAENKYVGIFDMATGTGKTLTSIAALHSLFINNHERLGIIIVCPYQHLVNQWEEDIVNCGIVPILGFSSSRQKSWKKHLHQEINSFLSHGSDFFCFVTTNKTFVSKYVQTEINKLINDSVIVVDEAHNIGANNYRYNLPQNIKYRLALSATVERHNDPVGTSVIFDYFQQICLTYSLKEAIDNNMLTRYYYYPIIVYLSDSELDEYIELTKKISKYLSRKGNKNVLSEQAKTLLNKRARLIAGAISKIQKLRETITSYTDKSNILVYCGATNIDYISDDEDKSFSIKQIDAVTSLLGNELKMRVSRFTSQETAEERKIIKKLFEEGERQVLVAIKCLDEGVNIPSIKTAFILASSTNPKEYIQRRGRVLRKFPNKKYAEIYDFVTLPFSKDNIEEYNDLINITKGLIKRELVRLKEFSELAENPTDSLELIFELMHSYGISDEDLTKEGDEL